MTTPCNSWIIEEIDTGKAVLETMDQRIPKHLNTQKYRAWLAIDWLREFNRRANSDDLRERESTLD